MVGSVTYKESKTMGKRMDRQNALNHANKISNKIVTKPRGSINE